MTMIRLLGPVEVLDGDGTIHAPKTPIRRSLLALLALEAGTVVEPDRLLDRIWDGEPPESGLRALRFHLSRLRKEIPIDDLIVTVPGGYRLDADVDTDTTETALDRLAGMDPEHRIELTRELLDNWHGEPLLDVEPCVALDHERRRLTELHATLTEQHFAARVDAGETSTVVSELTGLCLEHPLREQLWASLITAQYRAGLQADALRSYDRLRRNLVDQLGADPSPPLQELERRILDHSPTLQAPPTATTGRGNLGATSPELIGREADTQIVLDQLAAHSLVTIAGMGGIGKSSLARLIAHRLAGPHTEVWFVELAPLSDPEDVLSTITATVGITSATPTPNDLAILLRRRGDVLLVLDNCEHVIDEAATVAARLADEPGLRVLTTSRIQLGVREERIVRLAPLDALDDAVELFAREARRRDPTFILGNGRTDVIRAICDQLDRIPLAIELAAARTGSLGLGDIYDQLSELLASRPTGTHASDRHATMTGAIAWSTNTLRPDAATGLGALSVTAGTFDLPAAAALVDLVSDRPAFDVIDELVANSLLEVIRHPNGLRYRVLEPVRAYAAREQLTDPAAARDRHLEHHLHALESAYRDLGSVSSEPIVAILRHDIDNLRAAHRWALETRRIDDDLRLYRPLMIADAHEIYDVGEWALETLRLDVIEEHDGWREALAKSFQTLVFRSPWRLDEHAREMEETLHTCGAGRGSDLVEAQIAWLECVRERRHREGVARWDAIESDDTFVTYLNALLSTGSRSELARDRGRCWSDEFSRAIEWARAIGARNLEAALRSVDCMGGTDDGPQSRHDRADLAVAMTNAVGMNHMMGLALNTRIAAILDGAVSRHDPTADLIGALRTAVTSWAGHRVTQLLDTAARVLWEANERTAAGLAATQTDGFSLGWVRRNHISGDVIEDAEARVVEEELDLFDVALLTIEALERLHQARATSMS